MPRWIDFLWMAGLIFLLVYAIAWASVQKTPTLALGRRADFLEGKMRRLGGDLSAFAKTHGEYPDSLQQLAASWKGVSSSEITDRLADSWDSQFQYTKSNGGYRLCSLGLDRQLGGEGIFGDILFDGHAFTWPHPTMFQFLFETPGCVARFLAAVVAGIAAGWLFGKKQPKKSSVHVDVATK